MFIPICFIYTLPEVRLICNGCLLPNGWNPSACAIKLITWSKLTDNKNKKKCKGFK